ncbi:MAG: YdeI/OmpD-associated family protein [Acidimicrobiia bacterium]
MAEFRALIEEARGGGGAWIQVPPSVVAGLGQGGRIPVQATFDGIPYRGSVVSMGGDGMAIGILKDIRTKLGKVVGDEVLVTLELDDAPREVEVPEDLVTALTAAGVADAFARLSFTRRREVAEGVAGAKKPETRQRRIEAVVEELAGRHD